MFWERTLVSIPEEACILAEGTRGLVGARHQLEGKLDYLQQFIGSGDFRDSGRGVRSKKWQQPSGCGGGVVEVGSSQGLESLLGVDCWLLAADVLWCPLQCPHGTVASQWQEVWIHTQVSLRRRNAHSIFRAHLSFAFMGFYAKPFLFRGQARATC